MADDTWQPRCRPQRALVRPVPLDPSGEGGPTRHQARNASWRRTTHGFYVPSDTDSTVVEQRIVEQSMRLGGTGAVTGWAALRMYGAAFFDGLEPDGRTSIPVALVTPRRLRDTAASVASQAGRGGDRVWIVQGVRCFGVERALADEIGRRDDLREAVVAIDMTCAARLTSIARVRSYAQRRLRGRTRALVLAAADLADEHSRSPMETRMRLVWVLDAGLPHPCATASCTHNKARCWAAPTCSTSKSVSSASTTAPSTALETATPPTRTERTGCSATGWRCSPSSPATPSNSR